MWIAYSFGSFDPEFESAIDHDDDDYTGKELIELVQSALTENVPPRQPNG